MKTALFCEPWYMGADLAPGGRRDVEEAQRARNVRDWIETGPGRLSADEMMVLAWYREGRAQAMRDGANDDLAKVAVLLVGNLGTVGMINHQLDHIGGGLSSVSHGIDVASVNVPEEHPDAEGWLTPAPLHPVAVMANRLCAHEIWSADMAMKHRGLSALEGKARA